MKSWTGLILLSVLVIGCARDYDSARDVAIEMGKAACARAAECGDIEKGEIDQCVDLFVAEICRGRDCGGKPAVPNDVISDCIDAVSELSCTNPITPAECFF